MSRDLRRTGMFLLLLAAPAAAQFVELATTDDGSQLYFSTRMLLRTAPPSAPRESRVYRFTAGALSIFAENPAVTTANVRGDGVGTASVSSDASVVAFVRRDVCVDAECSELAHRVEVRGPDAIDLGPARFVAISRNGRWALTDDWQEAGNITHLIDLTTRQKTRIPYWPVSWGAVLSPVSSDGSVLVGQSKEQPDGSRQFQYGIWKEGAYRPVALPKGLFPIRMTEDAQKILAYPEELSDTRLVVVSLAAQDVTVIAETRHGEVPYFHSASPDARRVLWAAGTEYRLEGSIFVWDAATGASIPVPLNPGELALEGVLTGRGDAAFVSTTHNRIVRFDIASRTLAPVFPQTPYCEDPGVIASGSLTFLKCSFSGSDAERSGKIRIGGHEAPVVYAVPGEIAVQTSWYAYYGSDDTLSANIAGEPPFSFSKDVTIGLGAPRILLSKTGLFGMSAAKGDWSGSLTELPPAGSLFHVYMTGLGPVEKYEEDGQPAPSNRLNPIRWRLACELQPRSQPLELLFAGLAPGMLGVYQTTFRMPELGRGAPLPTDIACSLTSPWLTRWFSPGSEAPYMCENCWIGVVPARPQPQQR